jgi:hypothetical protein
MRLRALDLETTTTLHELLQRGLRAVSNRAAALAPEASPEIGDALGYLSTDTARLGAVVDVLVNRERFSSK